MRAEQSLQILNAQSLENVCEAGTGFFCLGISRSALHRAIDGANNFGVEVG